jgi:two-component sensor histidine kinase
MALYELGTNAVKYGALSNGSGTVRVEWELLQGDQLNRVKLRWREGDWPPVKPPEHKGFGSLLLERALEGGLGFARLDYEPQGLICTLEVALSTEGPQEPRNPV